MMTGKQKLFYLLSRINDRQELTPTEESIKLHPKGDLEDNFSEVELKEIFRKLEDDDEILRVMRPPIEGALLTMNIANYTMSSGQKLKS